MSKKPANNHLGINILLADDHPLLQAGFSLSLSDNKVIGKVYESDNPRDACDKYFELKPDVVVMDIMFKEDMTGLDAAKKILASDPNAAIVILSQFDESRMIKEAYQIGAFAFIPKNAKIGELIEAIQHAVKREKYFLPDVARKLAILTVNKDKHPNEVLSDMEFKVYKLVALDNQNTQIADKLGISTRSVNNTLYGLRKKLNLTTKTEITKHALIHRIIKLDD